MTQINVSTTVGMSATVGGGDVRDSGGMSATVVEIELGLGNL